MKINLTKCNKFLLQCCCCCPPIKRRIKNQVKFYENFRVVTLVGNLVSSDISNQVPDAIGINSDEGEACLSQIRALRSRCLEYETEAFSEIDRYSLILAISTNDKIVGSLRLIVSRDFNTLEMCQGRNNFHDTVDNFTSEFCNALLAEVSKYVIEKNYRRSNIGGELFYSAMEIALKLGVVFLLNERLIDSSKTVFYRLVGFEDCDSARERLLPQATQTAGFIPQLMFLGHPESNQASYARKNLKKMKSLISKSRTLALTHEKLQKEATKIDNMGGRKKHIYDSFKYNPSLKSLVNDGLTQENDTIQEGIISLPPALLNSQVNTEQTADNSDSSQNNVNTIQVLPPLNSLSPT